MVSPSDHDGDGMKEDDSEPWWWGHSQEVEDLPVEEELAGFFCLAADEKRLEDSEELQPVVVDDKPVEEEHTGSKKDCAADGKVECAVRGVWSDADLALLRINVDDDGVDELMDDEYALGDGDMELLDGDVEMRTAEVMVQPDLQGAAKEGKELLLDEREVDDEDLSELDDFGYYVCGACGQSCGWRGIVCRACGEFGGTRGFVCGARVQGHVARPVHCGACGYVCIPRGYVCGACAQDEERSGEEDCDQGLGLNDSTADTVDGEELLVGTEGDEKNVVDNPILFVPDSLSEDDDDGMDEVRTMLNLLIPDFALIDKPKKRK